MTIESLKTNGWSQKSPGFIDLDLAEISREFEAFYHKNLPVSTYDNVAQMSLAEIQQSRMIRKAHQQVINVFSTFDDSLIFSKLWLVKSTEDDVKTEDLPYIPHIDKRRFIKAMIYLDDVSMDDGPLTISKQAPEDYEGMRKSFGSNHKELGENTISTLPMNAYYPCVGQAGTVVFFDTNCPHYAGNITSDRCRRVLRFDFEKFAWNHKTLVRKIIDKLKSKYFT